ncbi:MAG: type II secretion system protein [Candidatus Portnoybacteria bacterium]|nr:type II secretion system protein [Candidatus Portnoybacteria bacterium]
MKIKEINKNNKGFTLMELLVAIAIIGILSSIVLTSMSSTRERAKDGRRISDIKQIQLALELYYDVNSSYPAGIYGGELNTFLKVSNDPNGDPYFYFQLSSGQDYHLGAVLQQTNQLLDDDDDATGGFDGNSVDCAGNGIADMCYDLTP